MRTFGVILLLLVAGTARADWVKVAEDVGAVYYVDPTTIGDVARVRTVVVLQDYATPEPGGIRSRRVSYEVECGSERLRSVAATEHVEPMARDQPVRSWAMASEWLYVSPRTGSSIPPRTPYRPIVRFVCTRKASG